MATYKLEIDGSGAESGAQRIVKSFNDIKAAAEKMEGGVTAAAMKASASFAKLQSAAKPVSQGAIDSLKQLSAVFKGFRGPSDAAVRNTIMFLQGLQAVGRLNIGGTASLANLLKAIAGFKGPTPMAGKNTESLLKALRAASTISAGRGLVSVLNSLATFKGPSAYAAKNITAMLNSLAAFKAPRGLQAATNALNALTAAANTANGAVQRLNVSTAKKMSVNINTGTAHKNISSLIRQNNLWQMGILRTQTLWNALGGVLAARAIVNASNDIVKIRAQLEAATGSVQQMRVQFQFLQENSQRLGLDFRETAKSYGFFLGAIKGTGMSFKEAQDVFRGFSTAARALQLSTSDVDGIFRALGQIMSKGKLQAEELRQQLGDRLPGAFVRFARALDMTKPGELDAALKKGAISGDKLKKAIIEVAATMEQEFAVSADNMSKTVDAAFNRLLNSFVMAAEGLGRSGLNEGIINITDALRKFLESEALATMIQHLGKLFKFLGENINAVVYIMGTLALSATLKWMAGLTGLAKTIPLLVAGFRQVTIAVAALQMGMGAAAVATTLWGRALNGLFLLIRANPFLLIATALVGLIALLQSGKTKTDEMMESLQKAGAASAIATNGVEAYTAELANNNVTLDAGNALIRERIRLQIIEAQTAYKVGRGQLKGGVAQAQTGFLAKTQRAMMGLGFTEGKGGAYLGDKEGATTDPALMRLINDLPNQVTDMSSYQKAYKATSALGAYANTLPEGADKAFATRQYNQAAGYLDTFDPVKYKMAGQNLSFDPQAARNAVFNDPDRILREGAAISGEPVGGAAKGGKSDAEKWAEKLESALQNAREAMADLVEEAEVAGRVTKELLEGTTDVATAAASEAAQGQLKSFKDRFANAEEQAKGLMALAQEMQAQGQIAADADISNALASEAAITKVYTAQQKLTAEKKKDAEVAKEIAQMREETNIEKQANALLEAGATQYEYNKFLEIENKLINTSLEMRDELIAKLNQEIDARQKAANAAELLNEQYKLEQQKKLNQAMSGVYAAGVSPRDLEYYKEMYEYQNELRGSGKYTEEEVSGLMRVRKEMLENKRVMEDIADQYEKNLQLATDMADAIVDGFREGVESGKGFLNTIKDIFKNLKNIILDFVLYNPLRDFLKQTLQGAVGGGAPGATTTTSGGAGAVGTAFSSILGLAGGGGAQTGTSTPSAQTKVMAGAIGDSVAKEMGGLYEGIDPMFATYEAASTTLQQVAAPMKSASDSLTKLKQIFAPNQGIDAFKKLSTAFKTGTGTSEAISSAIGAAGNALAAYSIGKTLGSGVAKMLGGGFRTQAVAGGITGGAAAGFTLAGPVGAAVGAVVGGVLGFLKKKPKIPSSYGSVVVGDDGIAVVGEAGKYGKGTKKIGKQMADAAARMFNDFALNLDAQLTAGSYGTFGRRTFGKGKSAAEQAFYSMSGVSKKGKPLGREGIDWIKGTESEVQAFALIQQVRKGMITGLSAVMQTVFANTAATTMEQLQEDIGVGKAYEAFIKGSFKETDLARQVREINDAWKKLARQAKELGLSEEKLIDARDRMLNQMKEDFNYEISQGILEFENPMLAAYNDLVKEYEATVENAMAVGGDLVAVEKYYGLKRTELMKQMAEEANNGIKKIAKDLLTSLTASSSSPLSAQAVFGTAQSMFRGLAAQIAGGDYSNVDQLNTYATNYLDAARNIGASSTTYFDIFQEVTDFLKTVSDTTAGGTGLPGDVTDLPALPDIDTIVAEITARNAEIVAATENVGATIVEGTTQIVDTLNTGFGGLLGALYAQLGLTPPAGTLPASGTGVASTGGTSTGGGTSYYGGSGGYGGMGGGGYFSEGGMVHLQ